MSTPRGHTAKPEDLTGTLGDKPSVPQASFRRVAKVREHLPRAGADVRASAAAAEVGVALRGGRGPARWAWPLPRGAAHLGSSRR